MNSSIRKIIKCAIAFSFIFTVVGCKSTKSEDEMKKIFKTEDLTLYEEPYDKEQNVHVYFTTHDDLVKYDKDGIKYESRDMNDYELVDELSDKQKKKYQKIFDSYDFTQDDLENYMKVRFEKATSKYDKLSYKDKFIYMLKNNFSDDDEIKDGKEFLNGLSKNDIKKLYKLLMKNDATIDLSVIDIKEEYYKELDAPKNIKNTIINLDDVIYDNVDSPNFAFDSAIKDDKETTLFYTIKPDSGSIKGKYAFTYDNDKNVVSLALLFDSYTSSDVPFLYSGYLAYSCENNVDSAYDGMVIAINALNTVNNKNGFSHTLLLGDGNTEGFIIQPIQGDSKSV